MTKYQKVRINGKTSLIKCTHCGAPAPVGVLNVEESEPGKICVWTCRVKRCRNVSRVKVDNVLEGFVDPIFQTDINSYAYLVNDAEHFIKQAKRFAGKFEETIYSRTAILLVVIATEALINRVVVQDDWFSQEARDFFEAERNLQLNGKWFLAPLMTEVSSGAATFDKSKSPWNKWAELVRLRNDFVHPKAFRRGYMSYVGNKEMEHLDDFPAEFEEKPKATVYPQTQIPRDPYRLKLKHAELALEVVREMVDELDQFFQGNLKADDWINKDQLTLVYPKGLSLGELTW